MESRPFQLLHGVVRIANRSLDDPPRALQRILRLLKRRLALRHCRLLLLAPDKKSFRRLLEPTGLPAFTSTVHSFADSQAGRCLAEHRPVGQDGLWFFPIFTAAADWGVLVVEGSATSLAAGNEALLPAVCEQLALLLAAGGTQAEDRPEHSLVRWQALSAENDRKFREISLLYRLSRAMHSTLRLNELMHLILSAATLPEGGGFERAMLLMVNERSGILQGMLGVTSQTAALVLPSVKQARDWEHPVVTAASREKQRQAPFCRQVMKLRLPLDSEDNPLARAAVERRIVQVDGRGAERPALPIRPGLGAFASIPLLGRDRPLAVLVVDNPSMTGTFSPGRLRFLQLFAGQAEAAMENSMLIHRLETAHQDLRETQERLLQGEKMAVLGEMAASVAHELKNPLVSIGGFARRLARQAEKGGEGEDEGGYAGIIAREVRRMEKMLSNILAFSKQNMLCLKECGLPEILDEVLAMEGDALARAGIEVVMERPIGLPSLLGDEQKLRQVVHNLVANARQAMEPEGGVLKVRLYTGKLRGDRAIVLEVEDTGGGIPVEVMRNIFNPFFSTKDQGTGLGLSISHRIVEHHGGEIEVENREQGAAFIVRLPAERRSKLSIDKIKRFG